MTPIEAGYRLSGEGHRRPFEALLNPLGTLPA